MSSLTKTDGCQAKSGSPLFIPVRFALESATNSAPGFLDSKLRVPG